MSITLTFLGHSAVLLEDGTHTVVIDPFLTGNPKAARTPGEIHAKHIVVTHGHSDHLGDAVAIARANKGTVYASNEVALYCGAQGVANEPANPGGRLATAFGWVAFTQAFHSASYEGQYMGAACGAVVHLGGVTIYHCGDTGLFGDMQLLGEIYRPDIALIPIGDRYTMGPELATRAAELIKPKIAVPIHYGTFPALAADATGFTPKGVTVKVLQPGDVLRYG
jgi:L-ascorbate metabolism protein UlaG (beta-lactamase superfamily)